MKVFISYSKEDYKFAKKIYDDLSREGITAWLDSEELLPGQKREDTIRQEIENSTYFLSLLLQNYQYDGSINRSYYEIFNAVRSMLVLLRTDSRSHSGVISFFDRYFVKTGMFDKHFSKIVHAVFDTRQDNDYEDFYFRRKSKLRNNTTMRLS